MIAEALDLGTCRDRVEAAGPSSYAHVRADSGNDQHVMRRRSCLERICPGLNLPRCRLRLNPTMPRTVPWRDDDGGLP
ncbi:hypothetical protein D9M68_974730 [compost metagenome]